MLCPHCGQSLPTAHGPACPHCGHDVTVSRGASAVDDVADAAGRAAGAAGRAVESVLEDPRLRQRLPGGSLPLLGSGLVAAAVLLPVLPFLAGSIGLPWSAVMLAGSVLLGAREWRAAGRPLPSFLERLATVATHPAFLPAFTALTLTFAFMSLSLGVVPLLWLVAAVVLGYVQWRVFKASPASVPDLRPEPEAARRKRWVLLGTAVCAVALLLPWTSGVGLRHSLGGYGYDRHLVEEVDPYGRSTGNRYDEWTWGWQSNPTSTPYFYRVSGRARTGATLMVLSLMALAMLAAVPRARASVPPLVPVVLAGVLTLWGLLGLSSRFGPWVFLLGVLAIDVAVLRGYLQAKGASGPRAPAGPAV